jgi:acyl carrier protein
MDSIEKRRELLDAVRRVLIEDLHLDAEPDWIDPDVNLYGTGLGLDSIDAVDLAVGVHKRTGIRIPDGPDGRMALRSVNALVDLLMELSDDAL